MRSTLRPILQVAGATVVTVVIRFRTKPAAVSTNQGAEEDAPGEDTMKLRKILFSFDGRIGRRTYWLAILALAWPRHA